MKKRKNITLSALALISCFTLADQAQAKMHTVSIKCDGGGYNESGSGTVFIFGAQINESCQGDDGNEYVVSFMGVTLGLQYALKTASYVVCKMNQPVSVINQRMVGGNIGLAFGAGGAVGGWYSPFNNISCGLASLRGGPAFGADVGITRLYIRPKKK